MPLELTDALGHVRHLNIRKEGADDDKVLAVDVKIEVEATEDDLVAFDPTLRSALFKQNVAELRFPLMGPVTWSGEMQHMDMKVSGLQFRNLTLKKFVIEPYINGKAQKCVRVSCSTAIAPTGRDVAMLAELVQDDVRITLEPQPALDLEPGAKSVAQAVEGLRNVDPTASLTISGGGVEVHLPAKKKRAPPKATKKVARKKAKP